MHLFLWSWRWPQSHTLNARSYDMFCYAELYLPPLPRPDWRPYASRKFSHRRVPWKGTTCTLRHCNLKTGEAHGAFKVIFLGLWQFYSSKWFVRLPHIHMHRLEQCVGELCLHSAAQEFSLFLHKHVWKLKGSQIKLPSFQLLKL